MKFWIPTLLLAGLLFTACSTTVEPEVEETEELAQVILAEERPDKKRVTFVSEDRTYVYSFHYDNANFKFLGYPLEGMTENGGAFILKDGSEIVTSTSKDLAVGMKTMIGDYEVYKSEEVVDECVLNYRVVPQETENLVLRSKTCKGQDEDMASGLLDVFIHGLSIDAL